MMSCYKKMRYLIWLKYLQLTNIIGTGVIQITIPLQIFEEYRHDRSTLRVAFQLTKVHGEFVDERGVTICFAKQLSFYLKSGNIKSIN